MKRTFRQLGAASMIVALSACSGGGGGSPAVAGTQPSAASDPAPEVTLDASAAAVTAGDSVTLTWQASNANSCSASGGWTGAKALSGSETVGPVDSDASFELTCSGSGGDESSSVVVQVQTGSVSVALMAVSEIVAAGEAVTLQWSSDNATSCVASGAWSGDKAVEGQQTLAAIAQDATYQLECDGAGGAAIGMVTVRLGDKTLRWQPPTQNVDGSALDDLAGYRIFWGIQSRDYTGEALLALPDAESWDATTGTGEFYFAMTAIDADDNESALSNEVRKLIP